MKTQVHIMNQSTRLEVEAAASATTTNLAREESLVINI